MKRILLLLMIMACGVMVVAQRTSIKKEKAASCACGFSSINQLGVMDGEKSSAFQVQTINGFRYKTWFAGIGVGMDYYYVRSIPVFLDIRKNILRKASTPFIYADGGLHFPWARDKDKQALNSKFKKNDLYTDAGIGYKISLGRNNAFLFSAGYSYKFAEETITYPGCWQGTCPPQTQTYTYTLNRLSLKAGLQF